MNSESQKKRGDNRAPSDTRTNEPARQSARQSARAARQGTRQPVRTGRDPVKQGASAAIGVVTVAILGLAALLVAPELADPTSGSNAGTPAASSAASGAPSDSQIVATGQTTEVTVTVDGMRFEPNILEVPAGNTLLVNFENTGDQRHDLVFENGSATEALAPGAAAQVEVGPVTAQMDGWCTLPGHRQMGMELTVIPVDADGNAVTAAGGPADGAATADSSAHNHAAGSGSAINTAALMAEAEKHEPYPAALEPLAENEGPQTHEYTFEVLEDEEDLTQGVVRPLWTYNGTAPGPVLRGNVGDDFVITLVNSGTMGHSIDFHAGQNAPNDVMRTIEPGESLEYRFTAQMSGIWMYHCSTMPMSTHIANGMFGAVIIDPPNLPEVDEEYVLIQSEFYADEGGTSGADKAATLIPDAVMFNGRAFQYDVHPLTASVGDRVRFWVLDVGPNSPLAFHIVGTQFDTWWSEGQYGVYRGRSTDGITEGTTGAQVLPLQAAQGGFVELVAPEAGDYPIVNHVMNLAEKGASGTLQIR